MLTVCVCKHDRGRETERHAQRQREIRETEIARDTERDTQREEHRENKREKQQELEIEIANNLKWIKDLSVGP